MDRFPPLERSLLLESLLTVSLRRISNAAILRVRDGRGEQASSSPLEPFEKALTQRLGRSM
jgi:hypothetical protein